MNLLTEVSIPAYPFGIDHNSPGLLMGSCFTENMGSQLEKYLFPVLINPFGVTYNPLSVNAGLGALMDKKEYNEEDLDFRNGLWFSFDHYTLFSSESSAETLDKINHTFLPAKEILKKASYLVVTWGTAWIYTYLGKEKVVCNCHKIPANEFRRSRLSVEKIVSSCSPLFSRLLEFNPDLRILLTISPVRHWKDGAHGNQLSKAILLLAAERLVSSFPDRLFYFPSYEIVMDELRDYRFYGEDMLHTSQQTSYYIWERFENALITEDSRGIIRDLVPLIKLMEHRPRETRSEAYGKMEAKRVVLEADLKQKYPFLDWSKLQSF